MNAQGEDVVAGVRTPEPVADLKKHLPKALVELERIRKVLESHFKDVQDFEFTIQDGKVFMLQTRNGKRTGLAAVRFAVDMVKEKLIDWQTAVTRVPAEQLDQGLAIPGNRQWVLEQERQHAHHHERKRDLEDGRNHRPQPADVAASVDRAHGVRQR